MTAYVPETAGIRYAPTLWRLLLLDQPADRRPDRRTTSPPMYPLAGSLGYFMGPFLPWPFSTFYYMRLKFRIPYRLIAASTVRIPAKPSCKGVQILLVR